MVRLGNLLKTRLTLSLRLAQTCHMVGTYLSHGWHQLVTQYTLLTQVAEYIPKRSPFTKHQCGADEAVAEYHKQIGEVANLVLNEYRQVNIYIVLS